MRDIENTTYDNSKLSIKHISFNGHNISPVKPVLWG